MTAFSIDKLTYRTFRQHLVESICVAILATGLSYIVAALAGWIPNGVNYLEAFAVFTSYMATYLSVKQRRFNYPLGAISSVAYCILFFQQGLVASALLNAYLAPALIYGWYRWRSDADARPVRRVIDEPKWIPVYLIVTAVAYLGALGVATAFGGQIAPADALILIGTMLAQFLLDNKRIETWMVWAVVNIAAIYVYFTAGLPLAGVQYILFLANTVWGYIAWRQTMKDSVPVAQPAVAVAADPVPAGDMRSTPVDNPLDFREDGSIREGDPAWGWMMELMKDGKPGIANQREDGTWDTKKFD